MIDGLRPVQNNSSFSSNGNRRLWRGIRTSRRGRGFRCASGKCLQNDGSDKEKEKSQAAFGHVDLPGETFTCRHYNARVRKRYTEIRSDKQGCSGTRERAIDE